jgi:orotate phosphoribosyltransferase
VTVSKAQLVQSIKAVALLHGDFTLRSGKKSNYYLDKYLFGTRPEILKELVPFIVEKLPAEYDRLAGPELGAITLTTATAMAVNKPFVLVRKAAKEYGTAKAFEGEIKPGEKIVIIEDILTTGGAALDAAKRLRDFGCDVVKIIGIIDRQEGAFENIKAAGFEADAVINKTDLGIE